MAFIKGCTNIQCGQKHKEVKFKEDDLFCPKCGKELSYVCGKCFAPLEEAAKRCPKCQQKVDDRKAKVKAGASAVAGAAKAAAPVIVAVADIPGIGKVAKPLSAVAKKLPGGKK
jgi:DNA-directed RNA polymerase subunit RPC12/RpoP